MLWTVVILWYLTGFIYFVTKETDLNVSDVLMALFSSLLGGIVILVILWLKYSDKVIIKSELPRHKWRWLPAS